MPKIENPRLIDIELCGKRAKIVQSEDELSADEWYRRRAQAFAQLRIADKGIPHDLLDLVEHFKEQTLVQPFLYRPTKKFEFRYGIKVVCEQQEGRNTQRFAEMMAAEERTQDNEEKAEITASEALAFLLRLCLRNLKHAQMSRKAAPVRTLKLIPRSLLAEIAMDLLQSCETWNYPPGPSLNRLIRELLDLERDKLGTFRNVETQQGAAGVVALAPNVRTRELARALHVNASTISRWRRSPGFKQMVERKKEALKASASQSESMGSLHQREPTHEELSRLLSAISVLFPKSESVD